MMVQKWYLLRAISLIVFSIVAFIPKIAFAEDPNSGKIKLENPTKYSYEYVNQYNNVVKNILIVEGVGSKKIKFDVFTVTRDHVCELSGEAQETSENSKDYEFVYLECLLHLIVSDDNETIALSENESTNCSQYACGSNGRLGGYVFKKVK